jgi:FKBP-type peptidyl-prolyl cis-trans isomerase (trigger factor)
MGDNTETKNTQTDSTSSTPTPELEIASTPAIEVETSSPAMDTPVTPESVVTTTENVTDPESIPETATVVPEEVGASTVADEMNTSAAPETTTVEPEAAGTATEAVPNLRNRMIMQYVIATGIILVMGAGLLYALEEQGRVNTGVFDTVSDLVKPAPAAAVVNGVKIPLAQYEKNREQLIQTATFQGLDPENESIKTQINTQALDVLVNTELLRQAAVADGVTVSSEDIDARYAEIIATLGGEEALQAKMTELNITPESLRTDIEGEILIKKHLDKAVDYSTITLDPAEVQAVYDQANTPGADIPPFAEVKSQIETQLKATKEQEVIGKYIETLKVDADIKTNI